MNDYVRKLQQGVTGEGEVANSLVEKRKKDEKLHKNAYTSVIDAVCKMGVEK